MEPCSPCDPSIPAFGSTAPTPSICRFVRAPSLPGAQERHTVPDRLPSPGPPDRRLQSEHLCSLESSFSTLSGKCPCEVAVSGSAPWAKPSRIQRMTEFEEAQEHLEHAAHEHKGAAHTRTAIIIAIMAAALALTEFAAKDAQTSFLTNHIGSSDTWAQYQAKSIRRTVLSSEAELLESLSTTTDPVIKKRIADALANADPLRS